MNHKMASPAIRKFLYILIFYGLYFNGMLLLLIPGIYSQTIYLLFLLIFFTIGIMDTIARPVTDVDKEVDKYSKIIFAFWLIHPFIFALMYFENAYIVSQYLNVLDNISLSWFGLVLYLIGGMIAIGSRIQLGKQGSGRLIIQEKHSLITSGFYKLVRNPMYTGGFIGTIAFGLVFRSIIMTCLAAILFFAIFRQRLLFEEELMESEFGESYLEYKRKTKRLIPGLY